MEFVNAVIQELIEWQRRTTAQNQRILMLDGKDRAHRTPAEEAELKRLIGPIGEDLLD